MFTNKEILEIAMQQSAIDSSCNADDFKSHENKVVTSSANPNARRYLKLPFDLNLVSYGSNIVASVSPEIDGITDIANSFINSHPTEYCFETPAIYQLNEKLKNFNLSVCFMSQYFLPDVNLVKEMTCEYETKVLYPSDFECYYLPEWSNALCERRKSLDRLAVGAFDKGKLIGLAGASADCDTMWQIGIDVLPEYRRKGIACSLTSQLALEILKKNIVPFYGAAWSNIGSVRNAIKCGYRTAWVDITVKSIAFINKMNNI